MSSEGPPGSIYPRQVIQGSRQSQEPDLAFVLQPINPGFDSVLQVIREAGGAAGLRVQRADDIRHPGAIVTQVVDKICRARVLLADLSDRNANVFYELGIGHAVREDVILLAQDVQSVPFDLRHLRLIVYDRENLDNLRNALSQAIAEVMALPAATRLIPTTAATRSGETDSDMIRARNLADPRSPSFGRNAQSLLLAVPGRDCERECISFAVLSIVPTTMPPINHDVLWDSVQQNRHPGGKSPADGTSIRQTTDGILIAEEADRPEFAGKLRRYTLFGESGYIEWGRALGGCYRDLCLVRLTPLLLTARDLLRYRLNLGAPLRSAEAQLFVSIAGTAGTVLSHLGTGWTEPWNDIRSFKPTCEVPNIQIRLPAANQEDELLPSLKVLDRRINRFYSVDENRGFNHPRHGNSDEFSDEDDWWEP